MKLQAVKESACLFCGKKDDVQLVVREDGAAAFAICAGCRKELIAAWSSGMQPKEEEQAGQTYSEATVQVMREAAAMTEDAFEDKYLSDIVDRVIFEYVRGYGQTELTGGALGLLSIMTEKGAEVVAEHIEGLTDKGLIYPVAGKPGWYGADYPFADD